MTFLSLEKSASGFKGKVISFFKTNTPKETVYGRGKKLSNPKRQNKTNSITNPFIINKERKKRN